MSNNEERDEPVTEMRDRLIVGVVASVVGLAGGWNIPQWMNDRFDPNDVWTGNMARDAHTIMNVDILTNAQAIEKLEERLRVHELRAEDGFGRLLRLERDCERVMKQ